jgi:hypothetical protein
MACSICAFMASGISAARAVTRLRLIRGHLDDCLKGLTLVLLLYCNMLIVGF